ncbi:MAG: hypothetical protein BJ554DRAFT_4650 [Olpidium bornovanus]|uniref:Superoxide dismutase copper/zinc binding domain-containing protein n=1 Tax=Olpidium bornovanus TaxID=278681 RepID=A0A8H7ZLY1_9FUNG|nr:MAG: hypothetical protein BJ554DRAFT_4650 [Olpidium bornovanus]
MSVQVPLHRPTLYVAVAVLKGNSDLQGTVRFTQESQEHPVNVDARFQGLSPGKHGFHVQLSPPRRLLLPPPPPPFLLLRRAHRHVAPRVSVQKIRSSDAASAVPLSRGLNWLRC